MSITVSDLFKWYGNNIPKIISKNSPFVKELENNYLDKINQVSWISNEEDTEVERDINDMIENGFIPSNVDWERLYPQGQNFGFTDSHLNERENIHFSAIESLFESDFKKIPQLWTIFQQRKVVGNPSAFGIVIETGTVNFPSMFIVKSPQTVSKELLHEYLIGKEVCNQLRKYRIPNFPYFFGLIKCSKARVDTVSKKITTWCEKSNPESIPQIIMENIRTTDPKGQILPPQTLSDYISQSDDSTLDWVVVYLLGTMNAIFTAWKEFGFSHNDLHTSNVMLRKVPPGSSKTWMIPVIFDLGYLIVKPSRSIPTIIDFGKSTFVGGGKKTQVSYPKIVDEAESDSFGQARPVNDILHLMSFIQRDISEKRKSLSSHTFGRKVDIILEQIYLIFYNLLGEYSETKSGLYSKFKEISTLEEFRRVLSTTSNWLNLPSEFIFIENETFIQKFLTNVFQLEFIQPYIEDHYLKPQTESTFQPLSPVAITNVIIDSQKKRKMP